MNQNRIIATSNRGKYIVKPEGYVWNDATGTGYGSCVMGDIDYFLRLQEKRPEDCKLTAEGIVLKEAWNSCKKAVKCSYCKDLTCLLKK